MRTGRWIRKSCRRRGAIKIHAYCPQPDGMGAGRGFDPRNTSSTSNICNTYTRKGLRSCEGGTGSTVGKVGGVDGGDDNACRRSRQIHRSCSASSMNQAAQGKPAVTPAR
ncbi:hypothetical protein Kisp01_05910 [Kineosporia sp. NBRC 101677]|nr:hypothetical protein Kisp01_05910 [Kineosporia sp. NBRC 101677]